MRCPSCGFVNLAGADECDGCRASLTAPSAARGLERRILEGTVSQLKPKKALTIAAGDSVGHAVEIMQQAKVGCLVVLDADRLAGVISERELLQRSLDPLRLAGSVSSVMRADGTALADSDSVADAFHAMAVSGHRHLPVRLKAGGLGVVSARDLLRYLCA
jgi:CBS domain-containing protein